MEPFSYDLHVHSCLSPCGDDDMTPCNIAGMAFLNGLKIVALTDHNSTKNCPAFFEACLAAGVPFAEIRAVSNAVGEEDRSRWNIPLALANLQSFLNSLTLE